MPAAVGLCVLCGHAGWLPHHQRLLQGGWRGGGAGKQQGPLHLKLSLDAATQGLAVVRREAEAAQAALEGSLQRLREVAAAQEAAAAAGAELAAAEREVVGCSATLAAQSAAQADARAALALLQAELAGKRQLLAVLQQCGGSGGGKGAKQALQREHRRLEAAAQELEKAAQDAGAQLAAAAERREALQAELELLVVQEEAAAADGGGGAEEVLEGRRAEMEAASAALAGRRADLAAQSAAVMAAEREAEQAADRLTDAERALAAAEREAAATGEAVQRGEAESSELRQQLAALVAEVPELEAVLQAAPDTGSADLAGDAEKGGAPRSVAALRKACGVAARQRQRLLQERSRSSATALPMAEQLRFREQKAALEAARRQAATLATAAQRLQEGIQGSSGQVGEGGGGREGDGTASRQGSLSGKPNNAAAASPAQHPLYIGTIPRTLFPPSPPRDVPQVLAAHESVFRSVASAFASLTQAVLPAYRVRLRKVGGGRSIDARVPQGMQRGGWCAPGPPAKLCECPPVSSVLPSLLRCRWAVRCAAACGWSTPPAAAVAATRAETAAMQTRRPARRAMASRLGPAAAGARGWMRCLAVSAPWCRWLWWWR